MANELRNINFICHMVNYKILNCPSDKKGFKLKIFILIIRDQICPTLIYRPGFSGVTLIGYTCLGMGKLGPMLTGVHWSLNLLPT